MGTHPLTPWSARSIQRVLVPGCKCERKGQPPQTVSANVEVGTPLRLAWRWRMDLAVGLVGEGGWTRHRFCALMACGDTSKPTSNAMNLNQAASAWAGRTACTAQVC